MVPSMTNSQNLRLEKLLCYQTFILVTMFLGMPALAEDQATSRRVQGVGSAGGAEVQINQIDTSAYPKVSIFASVSRAGEPVLGLTSADFKVKEDEVDQEPLVVEPKTTPLTTVVTIDTSGSIRKALPEVQRSAKLFLDQLGAQDRFQVVTFSREVKVLGNVASREQAKAEIDRTVARGDTALYDALYQSISLLRDVKGRRAVVLLTDGVDDDGQGRQLSRHSVDEVLALAAELNVPFFTIGLGPEKDVATLEKVASSSGGRFYDVINPDSLQQIYASLGKQLSGQYSINYTSNLPADGTSRRLALVQGSDRGFKDYIAPKSSTSATTVASSPVTKASSGAEPKLVIQVALRSDQDPIKFDKVEIFAANTAPDSRYIEHCLYEDRCVAQLPAGNYRIRAELGDATATEEINFTNTEPQLVKIALNAGRIAMKALASEGGEELKFDKAELVVPDSIEGEKILSKCLYEKTCTFTAPAGNYVLRLTKGEAEAKTDVTLTAGELTHTQVVLGAGVLLVKATATDGGAAVKIDHIEVLAPATAFEAELKRITGCNYEEECSFTLSAGQYTVRVKKGAAVAEKQVEIRAGKRSTESISLNAGLVMVKGISGSSQAPIKMDHVDILQASNSLEAESVRIAGCNYEETCSFTLSSGSYRLKAQVRGQKTIEQEIVVKAGERSEVELSFGS